MSLRTIGLLGILLFGVLFSLTFASPEFIEKSAKGFVKYQIEKEVREQYQDLQNSSVTNNAINIATELGIEKQFLKNGLENELPKRIAETLASMCGYDCEKKKAISQSLTDSFVDRIKGIQVAEDTLGNIIKGKYMEIVGNLKTDLRIFLGSNISMFLILFVISIAKPQAARHLFLPGLLLATATLASSAIYIFGQDWFYTILYNDYMGFGYLVYIAIIFGFLIDITYNEAKVTTDIINGILEAIGSSFALAPC